MFKDIAKCAAIGVAVGAGVVGGVYVGGKLCSATFKAADWTKRKFTKDEKPANKTPEAAAA